MGRPKLISDEALLAAAQRVFVAEGITASTRLIAKQAGISEAAIYQRFPSKMELFFAAMVPPALDVEGLLGSAPGHDTLEHLQRIALAMLDYFRRLDAVLLPLMSHPSFDFEEFAARHPDSPLQRLRVGLGDYFAAKVAEGSIDADPSVAALTLFSSVHSLAFLERLGAHGGRFEAGLIRRMVATLWHGLSPRSERP